MTKIEEDQRFGIVEYVTDVVEVGIVSKD